jgi:hypothetical protein
LSVLASTDGETTSQECGGPTRLTTNGSIRLGPFDLRGFDDPRTARVTPKRNEVRLFAVRAEDSREDIVLRGTDCATGERVKLIAIGAPHPISLPSMFPIRAGRDAVSLTDESDWYAVVSYPPAGGKKWRLVATANVPVGSAVIAVDRR